jgi:3-methyladenine DNA glycosylase AlkD
MSAAKLRLALNTQADPAKAKVLQTFFKTAKGQYAEGDQFLGITVPQQRRIAKEFHDLPLADLRILLKSPIHEERLTALIILVDQFKSGDQSHRAKVYEFYLNHTAHINNWDLVDISAHHIVGAHLRIRGQRPNSSAETPSELGRCPLILKRLARSKSLWERRIAMVATFYYIRQGQAEPALTIAEMLLKDEHDLMHKAVGWMLREVGKRCSVKVLEDFLAKHHKTMARTTLRYAIEHFSPEKRQTYLRGIE